MGISLKSAFIISAIVHAGIFVPFYNQHLIKQDIDKKNSIVVDYIILKEMTSASPANKEVVVNVPQSPRVDIKKEAAAKQAPQDLKKVSYKKRLEARRLKEKSLAKKQDASKLSTALAAKKDAEAKSDRDYVDYYRLIREKVRARLKENYRHYKNEGDVYLSFSLVTDGSLLACAIDQTKSTTDEKLIQITEETLKEVSPFPPVPKTFSAAKMSFNLVISFRK